MIDIPKAWQDVRDQIENETGCPVVIAGGCLRDLVLGLEPKDIDLFIVGLPAARAEAMYGATLQNYGQVTTARHLPLEINGLACDLVFLADPSEMAEDIIAGFDYGLCQIAYDGTVLCATKAFWTDVNHKTLTRVGGWVGPHHDRLAAKFEPLGYVFVRPDRDPNDLDEDDKLF